MTFYQRYGKRFLSIVITSAALVVLWPLILMVAIVVRIGLGSPVLFRQNRPGQRERIFTVLKFRTMLAETERDGTPLSDAERITRLGLILRALSLDELPQLWNVLRGDMSIIGPRPLLPRYLPYYSENERLRHSLRPGITGWAQINGRNDVGWNERLALDAWYVKHVSFRVDVEIFFRTIRAVLLRKGVRENPAHVINALDEERRPLLFQAAQKDAL